MTDDGGRQCDICHLCGRRPSKPSVRNWLTAVWMGSNSTDQNLENTGCSLEYYNPVYWAHMHMSTDACRLVSVCGELLQDRHGYCWGREKSPASPRRSRSLVRVLVARQDVEVGVGCWRVCGSAFQNYHPTKNNVWRFNGHSAMEIRCQTMTSICEKKWRKKT